MTTLSDKDLELSEQELTEIGNFANSLGVNTVSGYKITAKVLNMLVARLTILAERDAEQQPNAEAVGYVADMAAEGCPPMHCFRFNVAAETLPLGTELFTQAPSQGITRERLIELIQEAVDNPLCINGTLCHKEKAADAILAELKL